MQKVAVAIIFGLAPPASAVVVSVSNLRRAPAASHASGSSLALKKEADIGSASCPCIGIRGFHGHIDLELHINGTEGTTVTKGNYPTDVGSYCSAWDEGRHPDCQEGSTEDWCSQSWCIVDACNCQDTERSPVVAQEHFKEVVYQGRPVYYSYSTCGSKDTWTSKHNKKACVLRGSKEECEPEGGDGNCMWGENGRGQEQCVAWEAGGMCMDLPETSPWGKSGCPCIGLTGLKGTVDVGSAKFPLELGSTCKAWDMDHSPACTGDQKADSCSKQWCFVDSTHCNVDSQTSVYFPAATFSGHELRFSYATCGEETTTTTTTTVATTTTAAVTTTAAAATEAKKEETKEEAKAEAKEEEAKEEEELAKDEQQQEEDENDHDDDDDDDADDDDDDDEDKKPESSLPKSDRFDNSAYNDEWHEEWSTGSAGPSWRERFPHLRGFTDRQSDGKPSKVGSGRR